MLHKFLYYVTEFSRTIRTSWLVWNSSHLDACVTVIIYWFYIVAFNTEIKNSIIHMTIFLGSTIISHTTKPFIWSKLDKEWRILYHPLKLWKENSDSQQFHQYQNHLSLRTRQWHMVLVIQVLAWDRHKNMAGLNQLMGSNLTSPFRKHAKYISLYFFLRRQHFRQFK